ncbi:hypothetical protein ACFY0F_07065 [Streptomyces sp. NPDC001544]|uniref:hypothetical protein n=1 Tax=Streptomyces sp. NPDC001544 TaxID=3364584 RepID=UPI0036AB44E3
MPEKQITHPFHRAREGRRYARRLHRLWVKFWPNIAITVFAFLGLQEKAQAINDDGLESIYELPPQADDPSGTSKW